jgi:hypothetical protein
MSRSLAMLISAATLLAATTAHAPADPMADALIEKALLGADSNTERASSLVRAAGADGRRRAVRLAMLEKAVEYGLESLRVAGHAAAERALNALEAELPDRHAEWLAKRIEAYRGWYRLSTEAREKKRVSARLVASLLEFGRRRERSRKWAEAAEAYEQAHTFATYMKLGQKDAAFARYRRARHFQQAQEKVDGYIKSLERSPQDAAARLGLVRTLVVEMDDPARAAKHLNEDVGEAWRTYVPLGAKPLEELKLQVRRELGDWYRTELAADAAPIAKLMMLTRADACYAAFLAGYEKKDAVRLKVTLAQAAVKSAMKRLKASGTPAALKPAAAASAAGTLYAACDNVFELRINGTAVLRGNNWGRAETAEVQLKAGDVIAARLRNAGGPYGFFLLFRGREGGVAFASSLAGWRAYRPKSEEAWWLPGPAGAGTPVVKGTHSGTHDAVRRAAGGSFSPSWQVIWGDGNPCYVYRAVTANDLRKHATP